MPNCVISKVLAAKPWMKLRKSWRSWSSNMHRHGYQGRKLNRERDQRRALIGGLADSLIKYESIETTLPKAKEVVPYVEKLITKAKIGDLHNRRQIISSLQTLESAHKLVDQLAPLLKGRDSGHLRITKTRVRKGD